MINIFKRIILNSVKEVKLLKHAGKRHQCPICRFNSKDLGPIGFDIAVLTEKEVIGAGKRNGVCYKCSSSDRERLIYTYLKYKIKVFSKSKKFKILHIAPESNISKGLFDFGFDEYVCGDLFTKGYSYPEHVTNMNILNIPYEDNYFDLIICNHVLEHVLNDFDAMKELFRVLKNNGMAILQVPISKNSEKTFEDYSITEPEQREIVFGQFDHVRLYGQDYTKRLESVGFQTERVNISKEFPKYGLVEDEDIFIGKK